MKNRIRYVITVFVALLFIIVGNKVAVKDLKISEENYQETVAAKITKIIERNEQKYETDNIEMIDITFEAVVTSGERKGEFITATQNLVSISNGHVKEVENGDKVVLTTFEYGAEWYFMEYVRTDKLIALGIVFALGLLVFGRKKGFNTIISLGFTCAAIFAVFIPAILSGKNIYFLSIIICMYTIVMTFLIVHGYNRKTLAATIGCFSGIAMTGIITIIMDKVLYLTGMINEESFYLTTLPIENTINLRGIIFGAILVGAMGAIIDVSMSIASSLWEVHEQAKDIKFKELMKSGMNIGQDMMGTMTSTLILAYIGSSLSIVLLFSVYHDSLIGMLNMELIVVEILQTIVRQLRYTVYYTAHFCSVCIYLL